MSESSVGERVVDFGWEVVYSDGRTVVEGSGGGGVDGGRKYRGRRVLTRDSVNGCEVSSNL